MQLHESTEPAHRFHARLEKIEKPATFLWQLIWAQGQSLSLRVLIQYERWFMRIARGCGEYLAPSLNTVA